MQDKKKEVKKKRNFRMSRDRPGKTEDQKKNLRITDQKKRDMGTGLLKKKKMERIENGHGRERWRTDIVSEETEKSLSDMVDHKKKRRVKRPQRLVTAETQTEFSCQETQPKHVDKLRDKRSTNLVHDDAGTVLEGKKKRYRAKALKEVKKLRSVRYENAEAEQKSVKLLKTGDAEKSKLVHTVKREEADKKSVKSTEVSGSGSSATNINRQIQMNGKNTGSFQQRLYHEKKASSRQFYFESRYTDTMLKRKPIGNLAGSIVNQKLKEADRDNVGVEAVHKSLLYGDTAFQTYRKHEFRKKRKTQRKEQHLERTRMDIEIRSEYRKYLGEHPEMNRKTLQKIRQKQLLRKQYQKAYQAGRAAKEKKETVIRTANITTKIARKAQEIVARNIAAIIALAILMVLMLFIMAGFQSCSMMFGDSISTVVSVSYVAEPEEIEMAELYYTELEAKLQQKINQMEAEYPGLDEYRYNIAAIGHDPHTLISYLTAKYGDFKFKDVKKELETLFELQYGVSVSAETETRTETKTIQVGESLGNVVTSGYCNCILCCGIWSGGPTASGVMPTADHTIAVDAKEPFLPLGTKVVMNGKEYVVEDTGNFARYGVQFDVYYGDHVTASAHGHQTWECFLAGGNANSVEISKEVTVDVLNMSLQTTFLRNLVTERLDKEETELYEQVYGCRGNLQSYETPVELNWYSYISNQYGYCINPATGKMELHRGVDINVKSGMEVTSCMNGTVVLTGYDEHFGNYVVTEDEEGIQIKYAYLQDIQVEEGTAVTTDSILGITGSTGSATGSQMYLEVVKDGEYYNPVFYIATGEGGLYGSGIAYDNETVQRLFAEAELYLGMPYVWGGSSPSTSFDCSGFVSYVFTNSGICNMGRLTAQGIYNICTPVMPDEAQPGDIIFFTGTYNAGEPVTHVGIYAGEGMMIHCGDPIQYASIHSAYWQSHFYAFGRPG